MTRVMLTDQLWSKLSAIMHQHGIYDKTNLRMMVEGMLYRMRVGCPWRDLPSIFGHWNSIYKKFNRWSSKNKLVNIFHLLVQEPDLEWIFIDGSIVKAHQHSTGAASEELPLFPGKAILQKMIPIWIGVYINIDIGLKIFLHESNTLELLLHGMIN